MSCLICHNNFFLCPIIGDCNHIFYAFFNLKPNLSWLYTVEDYANNNIGKEGYKFNANGPNHFL